MRNHYFRHMLKLKKQYLDLTVMLLGVMLLFISILEFEKKIKSRPCTALNIRILNKEKDQIISIKDIKTNDLDNKCKALIKEVNCLDILNSIKNNVYVSKAVCYKTWLGTVTVEILLRRPIARLQFKNNADAYLDTLGEVIPISHHFTFRVPIVEVKKDNLRMGKNLNHNNYGALLFSLLNYIHINHFLKAQIAHIVINQDGNIYLYTQVGGECIEFGKPGDFTKKFAKLMLYYKKIVPYKGWNKYKRINLEFENQIVCE
jgi:cell division protein FtsQ